MEIKLDLPEGVFDQTFPADQFASRMRELAIIELLRAKRIHEHEAQSLLGLERWDLVERMERAGISPTEKVFERITDELDKVIAARTRGGNRSSDQEN
ncbi:MAG TPA: UPF0175 family protein [Candidatus Binataceae bacterium]|nr:UPF0175 family protein [Candidatus Binataceae bacterium]